MSDGYAARLSRPIDAIRFRDACIDFSEFCAEKKTSDASYNTAEAAPSWFISMYADEDKEFAQLATMRYWALSKLLASHPSLEGLVREVPESQNEIEINAALFEAAAVVPFDDEGWFKRGDILLEALNRAKHLEVLEALLKDFPEPS